MVESCIVSVCVSIFVGEAWIILSIYLEVRLAPAAAFVRLLFLSVFFSPRPSGCVDPRRQSSYLGLLDVRTPYYRDHNYMIKT
jgi:hypothetical protein